MKLQVEYVPIKSIKPYKRNAKLHPQEQIDQIKNSMKEFGNIDPIGVWHNEIVEGHGRYEALKQMGAEEIPIIRLDDLTDEQRKAYALAHNKLTMNSDFDVALLDAELAEIETIDMTLLGFDEPQEQPQEVVEDDFDAEPPTEPKAKYGDIYQLGNHRLMCGDSTKTNDVECLLGGHIADLLLTDPPYGVNIVKVEGNNSFGTTKGKVGGDKPFGSTKGRVGGNHIVESNHYAPIIGDEGIETAQKSFEVAKQFTNNQVIFGGNYFTDFLPASRCWYVWDKGMAEGSFFAQCELAWVSKDGNAKLFKRMWAGLCREGDRKTEGARRIHPTQKPVSLCCDIINQFECESVLDLFGGSGSTLIACEQLEKNCYMMELSPNYIDVIINRWETFTGKKAVKLNAD